MAYWQGAFQSFSSNLMDQGLKLKDQETSGSAVKSSFTSSSEDLTDVKVQDAVYKLLTNSDITPTKCEVIKTGDKLFEVLIDKESLDAFEEASKKMLEGTRNIEEEEKETRPFQGMTGKAATAYLKLVLAEKSPEEANGKWILYKGSEGTYSLARIVKKGGSLDIQYQKPTNAEITDNIRTGEFKDKEITELDYGFLIDKVNNSSGKAKAKLANEPVGSWMIRESSDGTQIVVSKKITGDIVEHKELDNFLKILNDQDIDLYVKVKK